MSQSTPNIKDLFNSAASSGDISPQSLAALNVVDLGQQIQGALGIAPDQIQATESLLLNILVDDSSSIRFMDNEQVLRDGYNMILKYLKNSKLRPGIMVHTRFLNRKPLHPYMPLEDTPELDSRNYSASGGTPLYDQSVVLLGTVIAKAQENVDYGLPTRSITLIVTDGHDEGSYQHTAASVRTLVKDLLRSDMHIVAAMGIDDGPKKCPMCGTEFKGVIYPNCPSCRLPIHRTDFRAVFQEMGIEDKWILTPGNSQKEILTAFEIASTSIGTASQNAASFSQTAGGGFANP